MMMVSVFAGSAWASGPHGSYKHTNRLINATSPYLLQHAHNPVDWNEWGPEAFEQAQREDKPIFLSIGYAACHWCHVMAHEVFENESVAEILNKNFVSIKVDREERPDLDEIYMAATVAIAGRGGWPMTIFMTPDREPFEGGTYFPLEDRGNRRGFRGLILDIARQWKKDRASLIEHAGSLSNRVRQGMQRRLGKDLIDRTVISRNLERLVRNFDPDLGGFRSRRNKFPPTMEMELILREYVSQAEVSKPYLLDPVETTLIQMARGGIYDHIGGGICRYSTDPRWFAPHFEKMLYDQARVSSIYLSAYQLLDDEVYARVARSILDFCLSDMRDENGAFYSSYDADSEGEEGKYYVWRRSEIEALLGPGDSPLFCDFYNVTDQGNWHGGENILHESTSDQAFARSHKMTTEQWMQRKDHMRQVLLKVRRRRVPPGLDDKILAEWNGLLITSLARASRILNEPRYRDAAIRAAEFIRSKMVVDGRLLRVYRAGKSYNPGYASDYANMIEAWITLFETTGQRKWLRAADQLNTALIKHFADETDGSFFFTANDAEQLLARSKNLRDSVVPSANSTELLNLLRLAILLNRPELRARAEQMMRAMEPRVASGGMRRFQWGVLFYFGKPKEVAIIGDPGDPATEALIAEVYREYLPNKVVALGTPAEAAAPDAIPLLQRKTLVKGKPGAYVCQDYRCGRPTNTPEELSRQLQSPDILPQGGR